MNGYSCGAAATELRPFVATCELPSPNLGALHKYPGMDQPKLQCCTLIIRLMYGSRIGHGVQSSSVCYRLLWLGIPDCIWSAIPDRMRINLPMLCRGPLFNRIPHLTVHNSQSDIATLFV